MQEVDLNKGAWKIILSGTKAIKYYLDGKLHREDGPAIEYANGNKDWYLHGKLHREDGPALEYANGDKDWYLHGKLHRTDGPAVERTSGNNFWYYHGKYIHCSSQKEFKKIIQLQAFW